jgi:hypothetical protein
VARSGGASPYWDALVQPIMRKVEPSPASVSQIDLLSKANDRFAPEAVLPARSGPRHRMFANEMLWNADVDVLASVRSAPIRTYLKRRDPLPAPQRRPRIPTGRVLALGNKTAGSGRAAGLESSEIALMPGAEHRSINPVTTKP